MNPIDMDIPTLSLFGYLLSEDIFALCGRRGRGLFDWLDLAGDCHS